MNRRGSRGLIVSSLLTSLEDLLEPRSLPPPGSGGGDLLLPDPGGVAERLDFRELLETFLDGVRYGVSAGVGSDAAGPGDSSSVSHIAIVADVPDRAIVVMARQASVFWLKSDLLRHFQQRCFEWHSA